MRTPRVISPSACKDNNNPRRPADIDEEDEAYSLAARRLLIMVCLSLILVPVTFALLRLMGFHFDRHYPAAKQGFLRRHLGAEALETNSYRAAHHGTLKHHLHGGDQSNDGEGGHVLISPVGPQVTPRYGVHEAKATNTRATFRRDSLLINAVIGQVLRHNRLQDDLYTNLPLYARLQQRAEDPIFRARFRTALLANTPAFNNLRQQVRDPDFQTSLQSGIYGNAGKYQSMAQRVNDPGFGQRLQQQMYLLTLRPHGESNAELSGQASGSEDAGYKGGAHVP